MTAAPGTLYGVGVGPGDPELLTMQAVRIIRSASAVAYLTNSRYVETMCSFIGKKIIGNGQSIFSSQIILYNCPLLDLQHIHQHLHCF